MGTRIIKRKLPAKLTALLLTAALVAGVFIINTGRTSAAPADINVTLQCESGIGTGMHVEVGATRNYTVSYLKDANSSNTARATITFTSGNISNNLQVTGVKAGEAGVGYGTRVGDAGVLMYQITDSNNISAYKIKDGAELYFNDPSGGAGATKASPVQIPSGGGQFSRITWSSMHPEVATVASDGSITSVRRGVTLIIGDFIDKWGIPRDLHILVSVGVYLGPGNRIGELLELIKKGEDILVDKDKYSNETVAALQAAVTEGKTVVSSESPADLQVIDAINNLKDAIDKMAEKLGAGVVKGPDGGYYKPVPGQDNVFEEVRQDGTSRYKPPRYVWGGPDRKPGTADDEPAMPGPGGYYVEDPEDSNIWKPVSNSGDNSGLIQDEGKIWGGLDGRPGGGDDLPVTTFGFGENWVDMGQNIWRKVVQPRVLGPLTGGGPTGSPYVYGVTPIFDNLLKDGKYYVGPLGPGSDPAGIQYYYGDPAGGNGTVDSTAGQTQKDDVKYYKDANGNMVLEDPTVVTTVTVNPPTISIMKGSSFSFSATVNQRDGAPSPQGVTWSVSPTAGGSSISSSGLLTVGAGETAATLTVTATSVKTNTVSGTSTVTVSSTGHNPTDIRNVEITPLTATVIKGKTQSFSAKVFRYNNTEDNPGVTWSLAPTNGGSTINQNGVLTVAAGEPNPILTVTATSKTNPSVYATVTVTVISDPDDGSGVPGLNAVPQGGLITIDGVEWIKVRDGRVTSNGVTYSLLIMKSVLKNTSGEPLMTTWASNETNFTTGYSASNVRTVINSWYHNTTMPVLKKYALRPTLYPSGPNYCFGEAAPTGANENVAFCPHKEDVFNVIANQELQNGYLWWTMTKTTSNAGAAGYLSVLLADGSWGYKSGWLSADSIYVRPAIFVKRGNN